MNAKTTFTKFIILFGAVALLAFPACGRPSTSQTTTATAPKPINTETEAIEIASQYVPAEIAASAKISVTGGMFGNRTTAYKEWIVNFTDITVTRSELGWTADDKTVLGDEQPYTNIQISLNGVTGELVFREVDIPFIWGNQAPVTQVTAVSRDQALGIASQCLPASVLLQSSITVELGSTSTQTFWQVAFEGFDTTRDALTAFGWGAADLQPGLSEYHVATINVDSITGTILLKTASLTKTGPVTVIEGTP